MPNVESQEFIAFSDGSCDNLNPLRLGGSAYIIFDLCGKEVKRKSKGFMNTTNNRMKLLAIISIVNSLPQNAIVTINTDSEYCIKAINLKNPEKNIDQLTLYHKIVSEKNIKVMMNWMKGHAGNPYNEECDKMARAEYAKMLKGTKVKKTKRKAKKDTEPSSELPNNL